MTYVISKISNPVCGEPFEKSVGVTVATAQTRSQVIRALLNYGFIEKREEFHFNLPRFKKYLVVCQPCAPHKNYVVFHV